uniref:Uncharacterized protein n=1 Tax=Sus scrofa TaxID=9823 RepID=A0A8D1NJ86_PIG
GGEIQVIAAVLPHEESRDDGGHFSIKTQTRLNKKVIYFLIKTGLFGEMVDSRSGARLQTWRWENKSSCSQSGSKGPGPKFYRVREIVEGEIILRFGSGKVVCSLLFIRE